MKTTGYGRSKPGPKKVIPITAPACEICRCLQTTARGALKCSEGHKLTPRTCGSFKDASKERPVLMGGLVGPRMAR